MCTLLIDTWRLSHCCMSCVRLSHLRLHCWNSWQALDKDNVLQASWASTRESEIIRPGLLPPWSLIRLTLVPTEIHAYFIILVLYKTKMWMILDNKTHSSVLHCPKCSKDMKTLLLVFADLQTVKKMSENGYFGEEEFHQ